MATILQPGRNYDVINFKGNIFGRTIYPSSLTVIAFALAKFWRGFGVGIPPLYVYDECESNDIIFSKRRNPTANSFQENLEVSQSQV